MAPSPDTRLPLGKQIRYGMHSLALFSVVGFLRLFGLDRASSIGAWMGRTLIAPLARKNSGTRATLRTAFPSMSEDEADRVLTGMYENIGRILAELSLLERFGGEGGQRLTYKGLEHLQAARAEGRGMIVATGHFGNWEMIGVALHHLDVPYSAVARPPNNPWVARWIEHKRKGGPRTLIPKGKAGNRMLLSSLKSGEAVVMLIDQHLAQGIPAPLFGQQAMTTHAPATLAMKLGIPVLPAAVRRTQGSHFEAEFYPPLHFPEGVAEAAGILAMTAELNAVIEAEVRRNPAHWLWMHRRFKPVKQLTPHAERKLREASGQQS